MAGCAVTMVVRCVVSIGVTPIDFPGRLSCRELLPAEGLAHCDIECTDGY